MKKTTKTTYQYQPKEWQMNANSISGTKIQLWKNGIMLSLISIDSAREMISNKNAFVISNQAIGAMLNGAMKHDWRNCDERLYQLRILPQRPGNRHAMHRLQRIRHVAIRQYA